MDKKNKLTTRYIYNKYAKPVLTFIAILVVLKIIYNNKSNIKTLLLNFDSFQLLYVFIAYFILEVTSFVPFFLAFRRLHKNKVTFWEMFPILSVARMANLIAPQSGLLYRAFALKKKFNFSYNEYVNLLALYTWLTILLNLFLSLVIIFLIKPEIKVFNISAVSIISVALICTIISPAILHYILSTFKINNPLLSKIHEKITGLFKVMTVHGKDLKFLSHIVFFGFLIFLLTILLFRFLLTGMKIEIGYAHIALFAVVHKFTGVIFISPGNVGVQELLYGSIFESIDIGTAQGIMASLLLRIVKYAVIFPLGIICNLLQNFNK